MCKKPIFFKLQKAYKGGGGGGGGDQRISYTVFEI